MSLTDVARRHASKRAPLGALEATVANPPTDADGFLRVIVDSQPGRVRSCPWMPRDVDPAPGDAALVLESDGGNVWVVCWWPQ